MATQMHIGGTNIPSNIANRGDGYKFKPPETVGKNGLGMPVTAGFSVLVWTFNYLTFADFDWWAQAIVLNSTARSFSTCAFYNDVRSLLDYTNCIVYRPSYEKIHNGYYNNVTISIDQII